MTTALILNSQKKNDLLAFLNKGKLEIEKSASIKVNPEHLIRLVLTATTKIPKLLNCTMESISLALLTATQLGLEPNGYHAHLVPFGDQCQLIPDYKGLVKLAYQAPNITGIHAAVVYENDLFEYGYGTGEHHYLKHEPKLADRGELIAAYAIAKTDRGGDVFVVMGKLDIEKRRKVSKSSSHRDSPWNNWTAEMWTKTAIKSLAKQIPLGERVEAVIEHENKIETIDVEYREKPKPTTIEEIEQKHKEAKRETPQEPTAPSQEPSQQPHIYDRILSLFDDLAMGEMARVSMIQEAGAEQMNDLNEKQAAHLEAILKRRREVLEKDGELFS